MAQHVLEGIEAGWVKPIVDKVYELEEVSYSVKCKI